MRADKNAPTEISSKKPVSRLREVIEVPKKKSRDPRFDSLCGPLDTNAFQQNYAFLKEYQKSELELLQKELQKTVDEEEKQKLMQLITKMKAKMKESAAQEAKKKVLRAYLNKEKTQVQNGKKPYFLKKKEQEKLLLIDKYNELKSKGSTAIDKLIEKKRKKNANKDHRKMPYLKR